MKNGYERIDATVTKEDGTRFRYDVLEMMVKTPEDETMNTEEELRDAFYLLVDQDTMDEWRSCKVELEYTWRDKTIETVLDLN